MRPNVKTTPETLNVPALPPTEGMELDYRTEPLAPTLRAAYTVHQLFATTLTAVILTVILRLTGVYTATIPFLAAVAFLGVLAALWMHYGATGTLILGGIAVGLFCFLWSPTSILFLAPLVVVFIAFVWIASAFMPAPTTWSWMLLGPFFWLLSVAGNTNFFAVFFVAAVAGVLVLCDAMTRHYGFWMNANPYLQRRVRRRWLAVWRPLKRWSQVAALAQSLVRPRTCRQPMLAAELRERTAYLLGPPVVIVATLLAVLVYLLCPDPLIRGVLAVATLLVLLVAYGVIGILTYGQPGHLFLAFKVVVRGLVNWRTYNAHAISAPGVFQSPYGSAAFRSRSLHAALGALTIVLLPACWYFPIGAQAMGIGSWLRVADESWRVHSPWIPDMHPGGPLTASDEAFLKRLAPERREAARVQLAAQRSREAGLADSYAKLLASPEFALILHLRALASLRADAIFSALLSLIACLLAPMLVLFATWWAVSARVLLHHHLTLEGDAAAPAAYQQRRRPPLWTTYVSRLRGSRFGTQDELRRPILERDHLLVGFSAGADYPVLLSPSILAEHAHITGDSGSGKSSLGIAPLAEQLIERGDCSVVILDLKGDRSLFEAARIATARANGRRNGRGPIPFRWFTNQTGQSTYVFNPFLQRDIQSVSPHQRAEIMVRSLGLDYGEGFGPAFFSSVHRHVMKRVLDANPHFRSFRQIDGFIKDGRFALHARDLGIDKRAREEASHLYTVIESLGSHDALNIVEDTAVAREVLEQRIDMGDIVRSPHVLYVGLASALEQTSAREIAKLALHCLLVAAVNRGHSNHRVYVFIDEFQQVVSHDLEIVLRQARSSGIAVILANQTLSDLKKGSVDIISTVLANTRFRQVFSASDIAHQKHLIDASGEALYEMFSWEVDELGRHTSRRRQLTRRMTEHIGPRLRRNDIIEATDEPLSSIVQVTRGHGFTQFGGMNFIMRSLYHIAPETYQQRQRAAWPSPDAHPGTIVPPLAPGVLEQARKITSAPPPSTADAQAMLEMEQRIDAYQRELNQ